MIFVAHLLGATGTVFIFVLGFVTRSIVLLDFTATEEDIRRDGWAVVGYFTLVEAGWVLLWWLVTAAACTS